jgi:hypothetical protein
MYSHSWEYPPDTALGLRDSRFSFTRLWIGAVLVIAFVDAVVLISGETSIPYNYPFYLDVTLLILAGVLLRRIHRILGNITTELKTMAQYNQTDPLAQTSVDPSGIETEFKNVLYLGFHPAILVFGALAGGVFVFAVMVALEVLSEYPYYLMNFGFGAAHGVFFGPAVAAVYVIHETGERYISDINLIDPDGVGGYRTIGNGIISLAIYGILIVTIDFVVLSSVTFTQFIRFQQAITVIYVTMITAFVVGTIYATYRIRTELLRIRDEKMRVMQHQFEEVEQTYWVKRTAKEDASQEAMNILTMYAMFHQMSQMDMWPVNLYSLTRLLISIAFSMTVLIANLYGGLL